MVLNENFLEFKYEDFLANPETLFPRVLEFLDVEKALREEKKLEFREKIVSKIKPNNTFKWKTKMSKGDIRIFELTAREQLENYGYEIQNQDLQNQGYIHSLLKDIIIQKIYL